jgi:hypothetical protein
MIPITADLNGHGLQSVTNSAKILVKLPFNVFVNERLPVFRAKMMCR